MPLPGLAPCFLSGKVVGIKLRCWPPGQQQQRLPPDTSSKFTQDPRPRLGLPRSLLRRRRSRLRLPRKLLRERRSRLGPPSQLSIKLCCWPPGLQQQRLPPDTSSTFTQDPRPRLGLPRSLLRRRRSRLRLPRTLLRGRRSRLGPPSQLSPAELSILKNNSS